MSERQPHPEDEGVGDLAAEYVLGVLGAEQRARATKRLQTDPAFRAEVEAWERRLAPLIDEVAEVTPPERIWDGIANALPPKAAPIPLAPRPKAWNRAGPWRAATIGLLAVAACLTLFVVRLSRPAPPSSQGVVFTATLASPDGNVLFVATAERASDHVTVVPVGAIKGDGRYPELWLIPPGGKPEPLGMLRQGAPRVLAPGRGLLAGASGKVILAVSLEPRTGSPTGQPTGPVIASGALTES